MSTATVLTLLVVPVFYTLFDDLKMASAEAVQRIIGRKRAVPVEAVVRTA